MSHKRPSWLECLCMGFECFPWVLLLELDVVFLCNCLYLSFSSVINWGTVNFAMTKSQVVWVPVSPLTGDVFTSRKWVLYTSTHLRDFIFCMSKFA